MKAVVVYESLFGNTHEIGEAIADGLRGAGAEVEVLAVAAADAATPAGADLLVVGGPTHVHGMSSRRTRESAVEIGEVEPDVAGPPLRDWIETLHSEGARATAFDTRLDKPRMITGSAARGISKRLRAAGFEVVAEESFLVTGTDGPLAEGEEQRAREWGAALAEARAR